MDPRTRRGLLALSLPSDLIDRIDAHNDTMSSLRAASSAQLLSRYSAVDADAIKAKLQRQEIDPQVVDSLLQVSGRVCAYCADGNASKPFQIHHIDPYAQSQDNSQENLLVVCPTHHSMIHGLGWSQDSQKAKRGGWYALREVAEDYAKRGLPFSYGVYEVIEFGATANVVTELLETSGPISSAVAKDLATHSAATDLSTALSQQNFVLLTGEPGSGKSTLALGVAGTAAASGTLIMKYRRAARDENRTAVAEILQLLECISRPCLLLLEDVNIWLTEGDVESLANAASRHARILATATSEPATRRLEVHLRQHQRTLCWDDMKPAIVAFFMDREAEAAIVLQRIRPPDWIERIGVGETNTSVRSLLNRYAESAQSAWQFMFLLRGGWSTIGRDLRSLIDSDRADIPLLYVAIEQIADFERAATRTEILHMLQGMKDEVGAEVTDGWVAKTLDELCARRLVVRRREAFTTAHRDWARAFISAALDNPRTAPLARMLLERDFDTRNGSPRRLMVLWSWFFYDTAGAGRFANNWAEAQTPEDWRILMNRAAATSMTDLGLVADRLHRLYTTQDWSKTLGAAFVSSETEIQQRLAAATASDWHWIHELFTPLGQVSKEMASRVLEAWSPDAAASLINDADSGSFDDISWFLATAKRLREAWVVDVGRRVSFDALISKLDKVATGSVDDVERCADILRQLQIPLTRSRLRRLVDAKRDALAGAPLSQVDFDLDIDVTLEILPAEMRRVVERVDVDALAEQFMQSGPQHWGRLLMLSVSVGRAGGDFAERLVDRLDVSRLAKRIRAEAKFYPIGVRHLLWQLSWGKRGRGAELAGGLFSTVLELVDTAKLSLEEQCSLRDAMAALDRASAVQLATALQIDPPKLDSHPMPRKTIFEQVPDAQDLITKVTELEQGGGDYDVGELVQDYLGL